MKETKLQDFVTYAVAKNRITFGDVCRLRRDYLPDGISSCGNVKTMLELDAKVERKDRAWTDWLVSAVFEFAMHDEQYFVAIGTAELLQRLLPETAVPTEAQRRIARQIRRKARRVREMTSPAGADRDVRLQAIAAPDADRPAWPLAA
jgi:hypothetical protein